MAIVNDEVFKLAILLISQGASFIRWLVDLEGQGRGRGRFCYRPATEFDDTAPRRGILAPIPHPA